MKDYNGDGVIEADGGLWWLSGAYIGNYEHVFIFLYVCEYVVDFIICRRG